MYTMKVEKILKIYTKFTCVNSNRAAGENRRS